MMVAFAAALIHTAPRSFEAPPAPALKASRPAPESASTDSRAYATVRAAVLRGIKRMGPSADFVSVAAGSIRPEAAIARVFAWPPLVFSASHPAPDAGRAPPLLLLG
jgi:hypothetical protein